jgi:DNA-binding GntR family transcriptional regulator
MSKGEQQVSKESRTIPVLKRQTTQESVVDHLRDLILNGQLAPGERLVQDELAELLGVSRTPVREALHKLASEGLVTFSSYKGASVVEFSPSEVEEIYAVRMALESHAAYLAAQKITEDELGRLETLLYQMEEAFRRKNSALLVEAHYHFHIGVCAAAKRERLYALIVQHLDLSNIYQPMALSMGRGARDPIVEHQRILAALQQRDADGARDLIRGHLQMTVSELLEFFHTDAADE